MLDNIYWASRGKHQDLADKLQAMIPHEGSVRNPEKNKKLEKFRKASNVYYDLFNNGLCNRANQFYGVFGFAAGDYRLNFGGPLGDRYASTFWHKVEARMDEIVLEAAREQGLLEERVEE